MTDQNSNQEAVRAMYPTMAATPAPPSTPGNSPAPAAAPPRAAPVQAPVKPADRAAGLKALYPSLSGAPAAKKEAPGSPASRTPAPPRVLSSPPEKPPGAWVPITSDDTAAEGLYPPGGSPPVDGSYAPAIDPLFEPEEHQARYNQAPDEVHKDLAANRAGLQEAFQSLGVGMPGAKEVALVAREYVEFPLSEEARATAMNDSLVLLQEEYGDNLIPNLEGAQRVILEAAKTTPKLVEFLKSSGAGNDARLIRLAVRVAKSKGWIKKAR